MVEFVGHERVAGGAERRQQTFVRRPTRAVRERRLEAEEIGERALEFAVDVERAADETHRRRARTVLPQGVDAGLDDGRMIAKAEVVVAREDDDVARFLDVRVRRHRRREMAQRLVGAGRAEFVERRDERPLEIRVHPRVTRNGR